MRMTRNVSLASCRQISLYVRYCNNRAGLIHSKLLLKQTVNFVLAFAHIFEAEFGVSNCTVWRMNTTKDFRTVNFEELSSKEL